jgi:hypothetical protein
MTKTFARAVRPAVFAVAAALALGAASDAKASLGELTLSTNYAFGTPHNNQNGFQGSPDTGFFEVQNTGPSSFVGSVSVVAMSPGGDFGTPAVAVSLAPGAFVTFAVGPESSNVGGFNGVNGDGTNVGAILNVSGKLGSCDINVSYNDSQFHSGVFRTNPFGITLDNYVIQGGDPFGRDTVDPYETTQAPGIIKVECPTPEPSTFAIAGLSALLCLGCTRMRKRSA